MFRHLTFIRFGTFLFNSEKERRGLNISNRTACLWKYINSNLSSFLNGSYTESPEAYHLAASKSGSLGVPETNLFPDIYRKQQSTPNFIVPKPKSSPRQASLPSSHNLKFWKTYYCCPSAYNLQGTVGKTWTL